MSTQYTPGPWFVIDDTVYNEREQIDVGNYTIATEPDHREGRIKIAETFVYGRKGFTEKAEGEVNARIIAAAPDLLEALIELINVDELNAVAVQVAQKKAFAAIAKATGGAA